MKKKNFLLPLLAMVLTVPLMGCGDDFEVGIKVKEETVQVGVVGYEYDYSTIMVTYTDVEGASVDLKYGAPDLVFGTIDTSTKGVKELKITYKGEYTATVDVDVLEINLGVNGFVAYFELPTAISKYKNNIAEKASGEAKNSEFTNREDGYHVGTTNPVTFAPVVKVIVGEDAENDGVVVDIPHYECDITLKEKKEGGTYEVLSGADLANAFEAVDAKRNAYQFKIPNKEYQLSLAPKANEKDTQSIGGVVIDLKTAEGINVHNLAEFSTIDTTGKWLTYQENHGVSLAASSEHKAYFLHEDIKVEGRDLPSEVLNENHPAWVEYELHDRRWIFDREVHGEFTLNGNYFQLDGRGIPPVLRDNPGDDPLVLDPTGDAVQGFFVNTCLFAFRAPEAVNDGYEKTIMKNARFIGPGGLTDNLFGCTSLQVAELFTDQVEINNMITESFLCTYLLNATHKRTSNYAVIKDSKMFDLFDHAVYVWNMHQVDIINTTIRRTGGPGLILIGHQGDTYLDAPETPYTSNAYVDDLDNFETKMMGQEAWFTLTGASTLAGQIKAMATAFSNSNPATPGASEALHAALGAGFPEGRSFVYEEGDNEWFEIKALIMPPDIFRDTYAVRGSIKVGDSSAKHEIINMEDPLNDPLVSTYHGYGMPTFYSHDLTKKTHSNLVSLNPERVQTPIGMLEADFYRGETGLTAAAQLGDMGAVAELMSLLSGDFLSIFKGNMGIVASYYPVTF